MSICILLITRRSYSIYFSKSSPKEAMKTDSASGLSANERRQSFPDQRPKLTFLVSKPSIYCPRNRLRRSAARVSNIVESVSSQSPLQYSSVQLYVQALNKIKTQYPQSGAWSIP
ncbi:hypothetical protein Gasu2_32020 [Galdieria sulphuraria]|nr:hypothetical protein Gasu2_32020 [Galdieria sulphuraria]